MQRFLVILALLTGGFAAHAQSFDVKLGDSKLGALVLANTGRGTTLETVLTATPLNVFNGTFTALSTPASGGHRFESLSQSSRKTRTIKLRFAKDRAVETLVEPAAEITPLSDPGRVPVGVIDPVRAIAALLKAPACPGKLTFYDGRRAITLTPTQAETTGETETCAMAYRVVAGPGHLSPLKISKAKMTLTYVTTDGTRMLTRIGIGSGPFNLTLDRLR